MKKARNVRLEFTKAQFEKLKYLAAFYNKCGGATCGILDGPPIDLGNPQDVADVCDNVSRFLDECALGEGGKEMHYLLCGDVSTDEGRGRLLWMLLDVNNSPLWMYALAAANAHKNLTGLMA